MVKRFSPKLLRAIDRAESYTRDVLDYGRAREADPKIRLVRFDTLVADVRDLLIPDHDTAERTTGGEVPVEFVINVPEGFEIEADAEQMFRVVHNICRNALEALRSDTDSSVVRRITVSARQEGCNTVIDIEDTGPGMPAKARENLFKAFHGSARAGGTGLGLAISQELVQAHGGRIELVERAGPGTQFRIELPRLGGKRQPDGAVRATTAASGNGRSP
jgi:signal transduction histidine kinase